MRRTDGGFEMMLRKCAFDARSQKIAIGLVIGMLKLAPATFRKMTARWLLVVIAERECSVIE